MQPVKISEVRLEAQLARLLGRWFGARGGAATTFADAGVWTRRRGLVLTLPDGPEFQLVIEESQPQG